MFNLEFAEPECITKLSDSGKFRKCLFALSGASSSALTSHVQGGGEAVSIKAATSRSSGGEFTQSGSETWKLF